MLFINEARRSARLLLVAVITLTLAVFLVSGRWLSLLQAHTGGPLYFFSVAEPFLAHVKLSFFTALFVLMPLVLSVLWRALAAPFGMSKKSCLLFTLATTLLFYGGVIFCYLVTLPFGIKFLLGFGGEMLTAAISVNRFTNFVSLFTLAFGLVFELPVFMIFCASMGLAGLKTFTRNRRYAILAIAILAALLTPTPDAVNMGLMGLPLYLLYETGIVLIRVFQIGKKAPGPREQKD